jgi:hypothetical protein
MSRIQQQILALFAKSNEDVREVIASVIEFEQENIHLERPRFKEAITDVLDRVARETIKKGGEDEH